MNTIRSPRARQSSVYLSSELSGTCEHYLSNVRNDVQSVFPVSREQCDLARA